MNATFDNMLGAMGFKRTDSNVESVRAKLLERSQVGLKKYGTTTERHDFDDLQWLKEAQAEAMDLAVYLEVLIKRIEK